MENDSEILKDNDRVINLFEGVDEPAAASTKPLTTGLGFKDKVSEGVYTMEIENVNETSSDGGTLDIGREKMGDGVLNIGVEGELKVENTKSLQPVLFHSGHDGLIKKTAKKSGESLFGIFIDALLAVAVSIFCVAFLTEFTRYKFSFESVTSFEFAKFYIVFATILLSYKICSRLLFGRTLGEWSSRHQLGLLDQQKKISYPLQVFCRELVGLCSGVFVLPLLFKVFKRDIAFYVSGLETYMEQKK